MATLCIQKIWSVRHKKSMKKHWGEKTRDHHLAKLQEHIIQGCTANTVAKYAVCQINATSSSMVSYLLCLKIAKCSKIKIIIRRMSS